MVIVNRTTVPTIANLDAICTATKDFSERRVGRWLKINGVRVKCTSFYAAHESGRCSWSSWVGEDGTSYRIYNGGPYCTISLVPEI